MDYEYNELLDPGEVEVLIIDTPAEDGEFVFTVKFSPRDASNVNIPEISESFDIKIWPRPGISEYGYWPDGMVGPPQPPTPSDPDEYYESQVVVTGALPGGTTDWIWSWSFSGTLPDSTIGINPVGDKAELTTKISGSTKDDTTAKDYPFDVILTIEHPSPNINGAEISNRFNIRIWNRAYLSVRMEPIDEEAPQGRVSRVNGNEPDVPIPLKRAVIPGTDGIIEARPTGDRFVMWLVNAGSNIPADAMGLDGKLTPGIGDRWGINSTFSQATVTVTMPKPNAPEDPAKDVAITGWNTPRPDVTSTINRVTGTIGREFDGSTIRVIVDPLPPKLPLSPAVRSQLLAGEWGVIEMPSSNDKFPPGLTLFARLGQIEGTPTETGTFRFSVGLTLPGTMRIIYPDPLLTPPERYSIFIDDPRPKIGDVDGDGAVTLRDLMLLRRYIDKDLSEEELRGFVVDNAYILGNPTIDHRDVTRLAWWFAQDGRMPAPTIAPEP